MFMKSKLLKAQVCLILLISSCFSLRSQVFTYSANTATMVGTPSITFQWNITFSNPSATAINVEFSRYAQNLPPYWSECICYIQCNPPHWNDFTISLAPFSSSMLTIQIKTDSVNPGIGTTDVRFNESGFPGSLVNIHLIAETVLPNGLKENPINSGILVYTDEYKQIRIISENEPIQSVTIYDLTGRKIESKKSVIPNDSEISKELDPGIYIVQITTKSGVEVRKKILIH